MEFEDASSPLACEESIKLEKNVIEAEDFDVESDNPFTVPSCGSDVALVVEGKKLHVHKCTLSLHSPVFRAMFTANFSEKDASEIELPGKDYEAVLKFLLHMYPVHSLKDISDDKVLDAVLPLAHEYQAKHVLLKCSAYIKQQIPSMEYKAAVYVRQILRTKSNVRSLWFLYICEKYDLTEQIPGVLQQAATCPIYVIEENKYFKVLTAATQIMLLKQRCRVAEKQ